MTRRERIDGLLGIRLGAYDDTLAAGPAGLMLSEFAPTRRPAVAWLVRAGWLIEYTPGHYRAAAKEAVLAVPDTFPEQQPSGNSDHGHPTDAAPAVPEEAKAGAENRGEPPASPADGDRTHLERGRGCLMTGAARPDANPAGRQFSQLRAPSACPQQPKKGQLALFGNMLR